MLGEKDRRSQHQQVDNNLVWAKVVEQVVDETQVAARVLCPERSKLISKPIPVGQRSTKGTQSMDCPDVGTNVAIFRSSAGLEDAIILAEYYTTENPPPQTDPKKRDYTRFPDGSVVYFDTGTNQLIQDLKSPSHIKTSAGLTLEAEGSILLKCPQITLEADTVKITGILDLGPEALIVNTHKHTGVMPGGETTEGPVN